MVAKKVVFVNYHLFLDSIFLVSLFVVVVFVVVVVVVIYAKIVGPTTFTVGSPSECGEGWWGGNRLDLLSNYNL